MLATSTFILGSFGPFVFLLGSYMLTIFTAFNDPSPEELKFQIEKFPILSLSMQMEFIIVPNACRNLMSTLLFS